MPFTTEISVRKKHGFAEEEEFHGPPIDGENDIFLRVRAYFIISVKRNGITQIENTNFTFTLPKKINFSVVLAEADFVEVEYASELQSETILDFMESAEEDIKAILTSKFGTEIVDTWITTTPLLLKHSATAIAGLQSERSMLRKGHLYSDEAFDIIERGLNREWKKLREIDLETLILPGELLDDEIPVGFGGEQVFAEMEQIEGFDYHDVVPLNTLDRKLNRGHRHHHHEEDHHHD